MQICIHEVIILYYMYYLHLSYIIYIDMTTDDKWTSGYKRDATDDCF